MVISDNRFGGEVLLSTGRPRTFDSIECLAGWLASGADSALIRDIYVSDYEQRRLIPVSEALFLRSASIRSPMGGDLIALSATADTSALLERFPGTVVGWAEVRHARQARDGHEHGGTPQRAESTGPAGSIGDRIAGATAGDTLRIAAGVYTERTLVVDKTLVIVADSGAILDAGGRGTAILVTAPDVTIRGLTIRNTGSGQLEERAAIKVDSTSGCFIADNRIEGAQFGVYLQHTTDCRVVGNVLRGSATTQMTSGNGIHAWSSQGVTIADNDIEGHRDGIYFEFVRGGRVSGNRSANSLRYGMHFMFSDDCSYERNVFHDNGNGIAVMYSRQIVMLTNRFERSRGSAAYGLLLKDINDSEVRDNHFTSNSTGLHLEGSNRNRIEGNTFEGNGLALRLLANATDNTVTGNVFARNAFDVGTNSRSGTSTMRGNWWDRYDGYDLNRDGVGDVPFAPVRLFALIVEQSPPALILLRSMFVDLLDLAERVMPALTPQALRDDAPLILPPAA